MSRRPGAGAIDRHALLSSNAYPSPAQSSYPRSHSPAAGHGGGAGAGTGPGLSAGLGSEPVGGGGLAGYRSASPFEQPYASSSASGPSGAGIYQRPGYGHSTGPDTLPGSFGGGKGGANEGLFGGSSSSGGGAGWSDRMRSYAQQRTAQDLEEANDQRLEGLSARVKMLKDISVGIGNEIKDSTKDLDVLGGAFSTTSAFLGGTFTRMNRMASRQSSWFCNMMLFIFFVIWIFVFLWWWRR